MGNKVDRCILELQMEPEDMYSRFRKAIEDVNVVIATYMDDMMGDTQVGPEKGTVAFGSGLHGWGFNVERFAKIYASKMGVDKEKMMKRLWGDSFFNAKKKTWTNVQTPEGSTEKLPRAFCQFIMTPINQLMRAIMDDQKDKYEKMGVTLGIVLKGDEKSLTGKPLMKRTMQIWINAADTLLSMIVTKLPSPRVAQKYRVENLYEGPMGPKERTKILKDTFDWDANAAQRIWAWGPDTEGANVVVDVTQGVQYLLEIKEHVNSAFQWASKDGPLCEENMRGIRYNLMDVTMHADAIHRGAGQIMPPFRRAAFAAELTAKPTLQEPVFLVEITCPQDAMSGVYNCMNLRRGCVFEENPREGTPLVQVKAYLPVSESFGFVAVLRQQTSGQAFPQCVFDHWENMPGDAMQEGKMQDLVLALRKRKNIKVEMPKLGDYLDKL